MTVVEDVKARGLDAVREWSLELDGVEPARAEPAGGVQTTRRATPAACAGTAHMTSVETRLRGT